MFKQKKKRRIFRLINRIKTRNGEGYIDVVVMCIAGMLVLMTLINIVPVFMTKLALDNYANELAREAEIAGRIGTETTHRLGVLNDIKGLEPTVSWNKTGQIQIGTDVTVTVAKTVNIGFYVFGSIPIKLSSTATGTSEVFHK